MNTQRPQIIIPTKRIKVIICRARNSNELSSHLIGRNGNQIQPIRNEHPNVDVQIERASEHGINGEWVVVIRGNDEIVINIVAVSYTHLTLPTKA